jgi:hypothetical protein
MAYNTQQTPLATRTRTVTLSPTPLTSKSRTVTSPRPNLAAVNPGDLPIYVGSKTIAGTIYGIAGVVVPNSIVKLVRQYDDKVVAQTTADINGHYIFPRDSLDSLAYYIISYTTATNPQIHGVSDRGLVPS